MNKIVFCVPFFANINPLKFWKKKNFPVYFDYFFKTFQYVKNIDIKIFTDIPLKKYLGYKNSHIQFYKMSFSDFKKLASQKLKLNVNPDRAYKVCDLKPSFRIIFEDYINDYDFWGYCDVDMLMGNFSKFFTDDLLQEFEIITSGGGGDPYYPNGYMILYKNCEKLNRLYSKSQDYKRIFEDKLNYRFDENGGNRNIISMRDVIRNEKIKIHHVGGLVHNDNGNFNINRQWLYHWQNGQLIDTLTNENVGSLHLIKNKSIKDFFPKENIEKIMSLESFEISSQGLIFK